MGSGLWRIVAGRGNRRFLGDSAAVVRHAAAMKRLFDDRVDAGRQLAHAVAALGLVRPVVLALPRGGVPVGAEVARVLHAPLDLLLVRKIGAPMQPELAVGAVVDGDLEPIVVDEEVAAHVGASRAYIEAEAARQLAEIARRRATYRRGRPPIPLAGRSAVVVDDGIATGSTVRAALQAVRRSAAVRTVLAVPVAPPQAVERLRDLVDDLVCLRQPADFYAVGAHYRDFKQVEDDEVVALLDAAAAEHDRAPE
jgi:putative phosphoribosyl transferase